MLHYARDNPLWVVSHAPLLQDVLLRDETVNHIELAKTLSETKVAGQTALNRASWTWPPRRL